MPALLGSSFRNRPDGLALRICATKRAATCAFSNLRVRGSRYSRLYSSTMTRKVMFPGWLLIRPPRPQRTSFSLSSEMMPPWLGSTKTRGGGMDPPFALGILLWWRERVISQWRKVVNRGLSGLAGRLGPGSRDGEGGAERVGSTIHRRQTPNQTANCSFVNLPMGYCRPCGHCTMGHFFGSEDYVQGSPQESDVRAFANFTSGKFGDTHDVMLLKILVCVCVSGRYSQVLFLHNLLQDHLDDPNDSPK